MNIWNDEDEYDDEETGFPSARDFLEAQSEERQAERRHEEAEARDRFNRQASRELRSCFGNSSSMPSGEMAEMSFFQGGFPDDLF